MDAEQYDVVVVGASIAGCTAATLLARQGLTVGLLERGNDPAGFKKICTHFMQPCGNGTLRRLGLEAAMREKGAVHSGLEVWTPFGWVPWVESGEAGYNLRRQVFDPMLRELAVQTPGVTLLLGHSVTQVIEHEGSIVGVVAQRKGARDVAIRAKLVVAADGRHGKLGELAKVPATTSANGRFFYYAYYTHLPLPSGTGSLMWLGEPDVAYCFPNDGNVTVVAVMPSKDKLPAFRENPERALLAMVDELPNAPPVRDAKRVSEILGMLELPNHVRPAAARGMAFIGDAALTSDPLFGVGCGWALQSAEWLADCVGPALKNDGDRTSALTRYREEHKRRLHGHHALIASASTGRRFNLLERVLFEACTRDDEVAARFQRINGRLVTPREGLSLGMLLRAVWVNLTKKTHRASGPRAHHAAPAPA